MRLLFLLFIILPYLSVAEAADLKVTVTNVENLQGTVRVALYNSEHGFPDRYCLWCQVVPAKVGSNTVVFLDLPPGTYALSVFHDTNNNGKLDTNYLGIPSESYGFSHKARSILGPPSFAKASFTFASQSMSEEVKVK